MPSRSARTHRLASVPTFHPTNHHGSGSRQSGRSKSASVSQEHIINGTPGFSLNRDSRLICRGDTRSTELSNATRSLWPNKKSGKLVANTDRLAKRPVSNHSQGTTIIHGRTESVSSFPDLPVDPTNSQSSSRRTTIYVGHPAFVPIDLPKELKQTQHTPERSNPHVDSESRREKVNCDINIQGNMIRHVSREDYLLGRGANPRTGIITPGVHSANRSLEEAEILQTRGIPLPTKWRQRGDAWISLKPGEPTPMPTPASSAAMPARGLRLPPKLNADHFNQNAIQGHHANAYTSEWSNPEHSSPTGLSTSSALPGAYPQTPRKETDTSENSSTHSVRSIPRKPLPTPPEPLEEPNRHLAAITELHERTVSNHLHPPASARSSSAPAIRKAQPFGPADVGKDLPRVPQTEDAVTGGLENTMAQNAFLESSPDKGTGPENLSTTSENFGKMKLEKHLPSLPTNNSLSQQSPVRRPGNIKSPPNNQNGPKQVSPGYHTPIRAYPLQVNIVEDTRKSIPMPIPVYDNPPLISDKIRNQVLRRNELLMMDGPSMTTPQSALRPSNEPFRTPRTTTTMSTSMITDTFPPRQIRPPRSSRYMGPEPRTRTDGFHRPAQSQMFNMPMKSMNTRMRGYPLADATAGWEQRQHLQRTSRPAMAMRAMGTYAVPKMHPKMAPHTELHDPSRQIGMQATDLDGDVFVDRRRHPQDTAVPQNGGQFNLHHESPSSNLSSPDNGLHRRCSRCTNGFVTGQLPNTGLANPASTLELNDGEHESLRKEPTTSTNSASPCRNQSPEPKSPAADNPPVMTGKDDVAVPELDERDHSACCSLCCKDYDCHEGCLSHPSPNPSPTKGRHPGFGPLSTATTPATPDRLPDDSSPGTKFSQVRSAFKRSFERSPSPHKKDPGQHLTLSTRKEDDVQDNSPILSSTQPLSPTTFWGSGGHEVTRDALEAAKAAIDKQNLDFEQSKAQNEKKGRKTIRHIRLIASPTESITSRKIRAKKQGIPDQPSIENDELKHDPNEIRSTSNPSAADSLYPPTTTSQRRNVSGASFATMDIPMPTFGATGLITFCEMAIVPYEASKMWLRNHPKVMGISWHILIRGQEMGQVINRTASKIWSIVFVYSKTGRLKLRRDETASGFALDCARSALYLLIFVAFSVLVGRILSWILRMARVLAMLWRGSVWTVKTLLGHGLLW